MADTDDDPELAELQALEKKKILYRWADDHPDYINRLDLIQKKYLKQAKAAVKKTIGNADAEVKAEKGSAPVRMRWTTKTTLKSCKDFDEAYTQLGKFIAKGEWKADNDTRGGESNYKGEKCKWRRRMTKDGAHFARIFETRAGYVLQKGEPHIKDEEEKEEDEEVDPPALDGAEGTTLPAPAPVKEKKSPKRGKDKKDAPPPEEEAPLGKRARKKK
jgi:hypothetical protein